MTQPLLGYRLVLFDPETNTEKRFDLLPTDVRPTEIAKTKAVYLPHAEIHIQKQGLGIGSLVIRGTFGKKDRAVGGVQKSGAEVFVDFKRKFWRRYNELSSHDDPAIADRVKVELYMWEEGEQWWTEPVRFDTPRTRSNKTFFEYDLEFLLLKPVQNKPVQKVGLNRRQTANAYLNRLKEVNTKLRGTGAALRGVRNTVSENLNRFVFSQIGELQQSLESFVSGVSAVVHIPARSLLDMGESIVEFLEDSNTLANAEITAFAHDLRRLRKLLLRIANTDELFNESVSESLRELQQEAALLSSVSTQLSSTNSALTYQGARPIRAKKGDTLPKLAAREMRDATQWESIALLNGLRYPYFSDTGTPGTLKPGETIWIPTESGSGSSSPTQPGSLSPEDKLYGRDLLVKQRGQTFSVVFENGDLVTVSGRANLNQAITMATTIEEGHLLEDSTYGLKRPNGKLTQADLEELKTSIERVAQRDDRVSSVEAKVEARANKTEASIKVFPIGGSQSPLNNLVEIPR